MNGKQISTSLSSEKNLSKRSHSERSETTKLVKRLVCIKLPSVSIPLQGESGYEENSKSVLAGQGENHLSLTEPKTRVLRSRVITVLPQTQLSRRNRKCGNGKDSILSKRKAQRELSEEPTKCKLEKRVDLKPSSLTPIAAKRSHLTRKTKKRHSAKRLKAESSPQKKSKSQKREVPR
ncbi:hypothetical protein V3C99_000325 [Haemonchus contortus]